VSLQAKRDWSYSYATLQSTAYINISGCCVGLQVIYNIGIHHVNHRIPFNRLPEAMSNIETFRQPHATSLSLGDIVACYHQQF